MIVNCNKGCYINNGTTNARLNLDTREVICDVCGDNINDISDFAKNCMEFNNDVFKEKSISSFVFNCRECKKDVKTTIGEFGPRGMHCDGECSINISEEMANAIKEYGSEYE
jgi:hypothetical protein